MPEWIDERLGWVVLLSVMPAIGVVGAISVSTGGAVTPLSVGAGLVTLLALLAVLGAGVRDPGGGDGDPDSDPDGR